MLIPAIEHAQVVLNWWVRPVAGKKFTISLSRVSFYVQFFLSCGFLFLSLVRSFCHKLNVVFFVFHSNFKIFVPKKLIHFYLGIIWFGYHEIFSKMRLVCGNSKLRWLNKACLLFLQTRLRKSFETRESKLKLLSVSF